jgi:hypothetical protein
MEVEVFELFKLVWDFVVLREAARRGQLKLRVWILAGAFLLIVYGVALPICLFYINHPNYLPLLIAAIVLVAISFVVVAWLGFSWWREGPQAESPKSE